MDDNSGLAVVLIVAIFVTMFAIFIEEYKKANEPIKCENTKNALLAKEVQND